MHSSRMRTARLLTVSRSIRDGGVYLGVGVCLGCVSAWGVSVSQHVMGQTPSVSDSYLPVLELEFRNCF